jgi:hypothetical protein
MTRQFTVAQFEVCPRTSKPIINPHTGNAITLDEIFANLKRYKSFTYWACVIHDKDKYTQPDIDDMCCRLREECEKKDIKDETAITQYIEQNAWAKLGDDKNNHIQMAVKCDYAMEFEQIARLLGVPQHLVKKVTGKGALLDCTRYLTHEEEKQQKLGKHRYDDTEIHTSDSFADWRKQLDNQEEDTKIYGAGRTQIEKAILDVQNGRKTINQCFREMDGIDYDKAKKRLISARGDYLEKRAVLPNTRLSFYVEGSGGIGKDTLCLLLSRALFPDIEHIEDIAHNVSDPRIAFDKYDGQPVIIWSDMRAGQFIGDFGRRAVIENFFEIHPKPNASSVNIKYGSTRLTHHFNIINGIEPYRVFIEGLAGEYKDKNGIQHHAERHQLSQFFRRMPIIIPLRENDFDILINKGIFEGTREYSQYIEYANMVGSFAKLQRLYGGDTPRIIDMSKPAIEPIIEAKTIVIEKCNNPEYTEDEKQEVLKDFGKITGGMLHEMRMTDEEKQQRELDRQQKEHERQQAEKSAELQTMQRAFNAMCDYENIPTDYFDDTPTPSPDENEKALDIAGFKLAHAL